MAAAIVSELVRCAINTVLEDNEIWILDRVIKSEAEAAAFSAFSTELTTVLRDTIYTSTTYRSSAAEQRANRNAFH